MKIDMRQVPVLEGPVMKFRAPSKTRPGREHDHIVLLGVNGDTSCCCEAGRFGQDCWAQRDVREGRYTNG